MDGKFLFQGQMPLNKAKINSLDLLLINMDQFPSCSIYVDYSVRGRNCKEGTTLQGNELQNII